MIREEQQKIEELQHANNPLEVIKNLFDNAGAYYESHGDEVVASFGLYRLRFYADGTYEIVK
jgi:hypothetical protein